MGIVLFLLYLGEKKILYNLAFTFSSSDSSLSFFETVCTVLFRIVRPRGGDRGQSGRNFRAGHVARGQGT